MNNIYINMEKHQFMSFEDELDFKNKSGHQFSLRDLEGKADGDIPDQQAEIDQ